MITFDFKTYTSNHISENEVDAYKNNCKEIKNYLDNLTDWNLWYELDKLNKKELIYDIKSTAKFIKANADVLLVIGVGGSYLGARCVIDALSPYFYNQTKSPKIYFIGTSLSSDYVYDLWEIIKDKHIIVNVISKSGTTTEVALIYEYIYNKMQEKYDDIELFNRIIITTDDDSGTLRENEVSKGYKTFDIPDPIGGRYCVFSPAGLLPIAAAGINIDNLFEGAKKAYDDMDNICTYAYIRNTLYKKGLIVEAYVTYEPKLYYFMEWLKQLYGESLGKNSQGILPISLINTTDLHSMGQFVQDGNKILFETVINVKTSNNDVYSPKYNKKLSEINNIASLSVTEAHYKGNVPNNIITLEKLDEFSVGHLLQFFMISCATCGYIENVNPFDQEGVEEYKKRMRDNLNK